MLTGSRFLGFKKVDLLFLKTVSNKRSISSPPKKHRLLRSYFLTHPQVWKSVYRWHVPRPFVFWPGFVYPTWLRSTVLILKLFWSRISRNSATSTTEHSISNRVG